MNVLIANLGSTSVKYQVLEMPAERVLAQGKIERVVDYQKAIKDEMGGLSVQIDAVAFKTVHGGPDYCGTYLVDEGVLGALEEYLVAAPVHNRIYVDGIRAFQKALPGVPLVAAFETEFHRTRPAESRAYGVPYEWAEQYGVRKYGFHGASHEYVANRVPEALGALPRDLRVVSCHLGGSSSICAIRYGKSIDCTMGFSPQSGIQNATRHGDLDLFAVLHLMKKLGLSLEEVLDALTRKGGLAGLSGVTGGDMRDIVAEMDEGNPHATLAFDVLVYEIQKCIGAYAVAMEGLDAIAFTGGIGENRYHLRSAVCLGLGLLGVELCEELNVGKGVDRVISTPQSKVKVMVVQANEELMVARRAMRVLS